MCTKDIFDAVQFAGYREAGKATAVTVTEVTGQTGTYSISVTYPAAKSTV